MQIATIKTKESGKTLFGVLANEHFFSFEQIILEQGASQLPFQSIDDFLARYTQNIQTAKEYSAIAETLPLGKGLKMNEFEFLPAIQKPAAIIDFALTPQHLENSAATFIKHEFPFPARLIAKMAMKKKVKKMKQSKNFSYYIGNNAAISGHNQTIHWPPYSSYLDIEPELAIVTGDSQSPIAGYIIFNDISARDVQMPELQALSLTRSKHFDKSNGLGPIFTPAESIKNPLDLAVRVQVGTRFTWSGNTSAYSVEPQEVIDYLQDICPLEPGTVIGLGTIPFCCGLDNNLWINPGETITIKFEELGELVQSTPASPAINQKSRWTEREELMQAHK